MPCCGEYQYGQTDIERRLDCLEAQNQELLNNQLALAANCCGERPCGGRPGRPGGYPGFPGFPGGGHDWPGGHGGGGGGGGEHCHCKAH